MYMYRYNNLYIASSRLKVLIRSPGPSNENCTAEHEATTAADEQADTVNHDERYETEEVGDSVAAGHVFLITAILELVVVAKDP